MAAHTSTELPKTGWEGEGETQSNTRGMRTTRRNERIIRDLGCQRKGIKASHCKRENTQKITTLFFYVKIFFAKPVYLKLIYGTKRLL